VEALDAAGIALRGWSGGPGGSAPSANYSSPAVPPRTQAPSPAPRPPIVPTTTPPAPVVPSVPGWTINSQNRWVCTEHYIVDCPHCYHPARGPRPMTTAKSKGAAILLAFLFGPFAWLYTWQVDKQKFWWNFALTFLTVGYWGFVAYLWALIQACARPASFYERYPNG
jgi:hypothetical protein